MVVWVVRVGGWVVGRLDGWPSTQSNNARQKQITPLVSWRKRREGKRREGRDVWAVEEVVGLDVAMWEHGRNHEHTRHRVVVDRART